MQDFGFFSWVSGFLHHRKHAFLTLRNQSALSEHFLVNHNQFASVIKVESSEKYRIHASTSFVTNYLDSSVAWT